MVSLPFLSLQPFPNQLHKQRPSIHFPIPSGQLAKRATLFSTSVLHAACAFVPTWPAIPFLLLRPPSIRGSVHANLRNNLECPNRRNLGAAVSILSDKARFCPGHFFADLLRALQRLTLILSGRSLATGPPGAEDPAHVHDESVTISLRQSSRKLPIVVRRPPRLMNTAMLVPVTTGKNLAGSE